MHSSTLCQHLPANSHTSNVKLCLGRFHVGVFDALYLRPAAAKWNKYLIRVGNCGKKHAEMVPAGLLINFQRGAHEWPRMRAFGQVMPGIEFGPATLNFDCQKCALKRQEAPNASGLSLGLFPDMNNSMKPEKRLATGGKLLRIRNAQQPKIGAARGPNLHAPKLKQTFTRASAPHTRKLITIEYGDLEALAEKSTSNKSYFCEYRQS